MSVMQALIAQQLRNPLTNIEMEYMTRSYMDAMDRGQELPEAAPYETDQDKMVVQLLPNQELKATWELKVNFVDGKTNTYIVNQHMKIHPGQNGEPCRVEKRRSVNPAL